jgi:hypothetical protein
MKLDLQTLPLQMQNEDEQINRPFRWSPRHSGASFF